MNRCVECGSTYMLEYVGPETPHHEHGHDEMHGGGEASHGGHAGGSVDAAKHYAEEQAHEHGHGDPMSK